MCGGMCEAATAHHLRCQATSGGGGLEGCVEGCGECGGTCGRARAGGGLWGEAKVRQRKGELHTEAGHPVQVASSKSPKGM